jgi:hypothetical protein
MTSAPPPPRPSPGTAALLSFLVPGAGQWYAGDRAKSLVVLCMDAGIVGGILLATLGPERLRSTLTAWLLGLIYVFVWIPAIIDAYQQAAGHAQPLLSGGSAWYVVMMLLTVGPGALPLLWRSARFSRTVKVLWTLVVAGIFVGGIVLALVVAPVVERHYRDVLDAFGSMP